MCGVLPRRRADGICSQHGWLAGAQRRRAHYGSPPRGARPPAPPGVVMAEWNRSARTRDQGAPRKEKNKKAAQDDEDEDVLKKGKVTERKEVKDLLALGRDKGFLTYDEVNDALPSDIVSSDQLDDVMSMFGDNDIAIVDEASNVKLPESTKPAEPELAAANKVVEETEAPAEREEEDDSLTKSNDPVRMYLRKMRSVSLLTREGEVEIFKRIEEGDQEVLEAVLHSSIAIKEIMQIADRLRKGKMRVREVNKRQIERIIESLKKLIERVDRVERELKGLERRAGMPLKELRAALRQAESENTKTGQEIGRAHV